MLCAERSWLADLVVVVFAEVLDKYGGYEPAVDNITIHRIIQSTINYNKIGTFLNSAAATEYTYSRVIDCQVKLAKIIDDGMRQLAISRRDRLTDQTQTNLMNELKEALQGGSNNAEESDH
jgi:hypothetical protein